MILTKFAESIGKGLFAGAFGTVAMTISSTAEMKLRGRQASTAPSDAAGKVLGVESRDPVGKERFSTAVHYGYGTAWGGFRGAIAAVGLSGPAATAVHFGAVWSSELVVLPALKVAPPVTEWGLKEVGVDVFHHLVYALTTGVVYEYLDS